MDIAIPIPTNIAIGLAVVFCVLLTLLLWNVMRRRATGFVAACTVLLGMFLSYQLALLLYHSYGHTHQSRAVRVTNREVKVWAEMQTGLYHCPGDASWGKGAQGKYMTQSEAIQDAFRPAHNQPCQ